MRKKGELPGRKGPIKRKSVVKRGTTPVVPGHNHRIARMVPLARISPRQKRDNRKYNVLRTQIIKEGDECDIQAGDFCTGMATDIHHPEGRGKHLLDADTYKKACRDCHDWIKHHPREALERGYLLRRNT